MPLRAYIDNEEVISTELSEKQWNDLKLRLKTKESVLKLACCRQNGYLRTSPNGLRHYVHAKSNSPCNWQPESPEHLQAKIDIIEACKENGWNAIPEFSDSNWRADVLATKNSQKIAFEVQWSKQTFNVTKFRQERYKESNVRGCWFFRIAPEELRENEKRLKAVKNLPAFRIFKDENSNIIAQHQQLILPLKGFVTNLLRKRFKYCDHIRLKSKQEVTIVLYEISCWKCRKPQHLWTINKNLLSVCDRTIYSTNPILDTGEIGDIDKNYLTYEFIKRFIQTEKEKKLTLGHLKSNPNVPFQNNQLLFSCFNCDSIFGDDFLLSKKPKASNDPNAIRHKVEIDIGRIKEKEAHWCYSENGDFCE